MRSFARVFSTNLVDQCFLIFGHVCQLSAITFPYIYAAGTQPNCFVLEVIALCLVEMSAIQIMASPIIIIALLGTLEVSQA